MLPVPLAGNPIPVLVFVHVNASPPPVFAANVMEVTGAPEQTLTFGTVLITGSGLIVIVYVALFAGPLVHPFREAVTIIVPTMAEPVALTGAVKEAMLPVPETGKPIPVFELVQLNISPPPVFALKPVAPMGLPGHTLTFVMAATTGSGLIVIVKDCLLAPVLVHPFRVAVTISVPAIATPLVLTGAV